MTATIEARVRRGALLLDRETPGWAERINEQELDLGSCYCCILGQLYGRFTLGMAELSMGDKAVETYGFDTYAFGDEGKADYAALAAAWLVEIRARLAPAPVEAIPATAWQSAPHMIP